MDIQVGDRVIVTKSIHEGRHLSQQPFYTAGDYGVVVRIDSDDKDLPYLVRFKRVNNSRGCMQDHNPNKYRKNHWWVDCGQGYTELFKVSKGTTWEEVRVLADIIKERE